MNDWPNTIARPTIAAMSTYSARGASGDALHLDANESPYAPPPMKGADNYNRYPAQQPPALMARLAGLYGVDEARIMLGRGADEAIDILLRTFCDAGKDAVLICPPTFGYFKTAAQIQGANIIEVPLNDDFTWDKDAMLAAAPKAKLIFLCSPNNPTGNIIEADLLEKLCNTCPDSLIVVDEAYQEFSSADGYVGRLGEFRNLVITRTLSKAYGLAGVRAGVALADPAVIALMRKVLPPYPVPRPVEKAVTAALSPAAMSLHAARLTETLSERERLEGVLAQSKFVSDVFPSEANFIAFTSSNAEAMLRALQAYNVCIRDFRSKLPGLFRISIGSPSENDIALAAFGVGKAEQVVPRIAEIQRTTKETDISVRVELDKSAPIEIDTGLGFFDHMLEALAKHGGFSLRLKCAGDLHIDAHHTVEDCALALGEALKMALGDKAGIGRFGFVMPMDETQARVAIDLSGRPSMTFKGTFPSDHVGAFPAEMCPHFFESLAQTLGAAIQIDVDGDNTHHIIEASFKGVARALRPAFSRSYGDAVPSTKGVL
ncbi:histidinol-phosphate transaminase [Robiginitomaculum antarcticum]|uniref:histidinol-phosphate transaminase n=1 Tax=Robiginitomaculum antarcticum TaxID=437507 RepID=UPI0003658106|nr:histidinol-phosphate transaminase [Robiginitomaculum antarcticum]